MRTTSLLTTTALLAAVLITLPPHLGAADKGTLTPAEVKAIAQDGYIFGLPLVYIAQQADGLTNVAKPEGGRAPFNQFDHHRAFPDAKHNKIVGMNVDTLYSLANLDLTAEPVPAPTWTPPRQLDLMAAEDMPASRTTSQRRRPAPAKRRP